MSQTYQPSSEPIPAHRRAMILERLRTLGSVSINDLADYLQVSASTVRRDLDELMQEGALERRLPGQMGSALEGGDPASMVERERPVGPEREPHRLVPADCSEDDPDLDEAVAARGEAPHLCDGTPTTMGGVNDPVIIALIVFAVSIVAGAAFAAIKGLGAWRAFRRFKRTTEAGMLTIAAPHSSTALKHCSGVSCFLRI